MRHMIRLCLPAILALIATGCSYTYSLVEPASQAVASKTLSVSTAVSWNKLPRSSFDIKQEENWTLNGPALDVVTFIGGVKDGEAIAKQRKKEDRQIPVFKANMSPPELVAMIESFYRIRAGTTIFEATDIQPTTFLGKPGMQVDYKYVGGDDVKRRGRSVMAVVDEKLYLMALDGTELHYFPAALPEFDAIVQSAKLM